MKQVLYTDNGFGDIAAEQEIISSAGARLLVAQCKTEEAVIAAGKDADALLVQWAPITEAVLDGLERCKHIVRIGIGVDNVDLRAATARGIAVSNVPDYCIDEVADHTVALALALGRQLRQIDARVRSGRWQITPDSTMPAFREMNFVTIGLGRIARAVLSRARAFGFRLAAFDPMVSESEFATLGVDSLGFDEAIAVADILSLHAPLNEKTRHLINANSLTAMKSTAVIVNTARGGLIDTVALADSLNRGELGGAGIDVFEHEPLEDDHPLRSSSNTLLTSHVAWFSESSVPLLQRKSAEEIVRGLTGESLKNRIN